MLSREGFSKHEETPESKKRNLWNKQITSGVSNKKVIKKSMLIIIWVEIILFIHKVEKLLHQLYPY